VKLLIATRRPELPEHLQAFRRDKALNEVIRFRHLAVHALAHREWPTTSAGRRIDDHALARSPAYQVDRTTPWVSLNARATDTAMAQFLPLSWPARVNLIFARSCASGIASAIHGGRGTRKLFAPTR
jgi:hypothetical protein